MSLTSRPIRMSQCIHAPAACRWSRAPRPTSTTLYTMRRAVVGINTSALIEAAILGKRSFTVADPRYQKTQEGTFHFQYLTNGGILEKAPDFRDPLQAARR